MTITQIRKSPLISQPYKVLFEDVPEGTSTTALRTAAYAAIGQAPEDCFGANVLFGSENTATVTIYKD